MITVAFPLSAGKTRISLSWLSVLRAVLSPQKWECFLGTCFGESVTYVLCGMYWQLQVVLLLNPIFRLCQSFKLLFLTLCRYGLYSCDRVLSGPLFPSRSNEPNSFARLISRSLWWLRAKSRWVSCILSRKKRTCSVRS